MYDINLRTMKPVEAISPILGFRHNWHGGREFHHIIGFNSRSWGGILITYQFYNLSTGKLLCYIDNNCRSYLSDISAHLAVTFHKPTIILVENIHQFRFIDRVRSDFLQIFNLKFSDNLIFFYQGGPLDLINFSAEVFLHSQKIWLPYDILFYKQSDFFVGRIFSDDINITIFDINRYRKIAPISKELRGLCAALDFDRATIVVDFHVHPGIFIVYSSKDAKNLARLGRLILQNVV
jgi:hypothetical protein